MDHEVVNLIEQLMKAMLLDYQLLMVLILVSIFGLMLVVVVKKITVDSVALALPLMHILHFLLLAITITVNQLLGIMLMAYIFSMTLYGMEQDVQTIAAMTLLNLGSIIS